MSETVYKGRNSPFLVTIEDVAGAPYTESAMGDITRARLKVNGEYADSNEHGDAFDWETYASRGQIIIDIGLIDFDAGTDTAAELIIYDADYTRGRVVKVLEITIDESVYSEGVSATSLGYAFFAATTDPDDPTDGNGIVWVSDGTETGDAGDILYKATVGAETKTAMLLDFSEIGAV